MIERYYSLAAYLKEHFGGRLLKLSIDGGFSCPNREGGRSGCLFCSESGSGEFASKGISISEQLAEQAEMLCHKRTSDFAGYIAYFQSYTNTYADVDTLRRVFSEAAVFQDVRVLSIATRADCISDEVYELLAELNRDIEVWVEIGLQTVNERTRDAMNIGCSLADIEKCVNRLHTLDIRVILHVIFGLPHECDEDFLGTIEYVNTLKPFGIKIHSLYLQNNAPLYRAYLRGDFELLTQEEYLSALTRALEALRPDIVVHRLTGDGDKKTLVAPDWSRDKIRTLGELVKRLKKRGTHQGILFEGKSGGSAT